jgi:hypothetical protein
MGTPVYRVPALPPRANVKDQTAARMRAKYGHKPSAKCSVDGCTSYVEGRGMCGKHRAAARKAR